MTPKKKDICKKHFRSVAVKTFSEICEPELLKVVHKTTKRQYLTGNKDEEDIATKKVVEKVVNFLKEKGVSIDKKALMQTIGREDKEEQ